MSRVQTSARRVTRKPPPAVESGTAAEFFARIGDIPLDRIRFTPLPGTATEADLIRRSERERLCELVHGTLVDKPVGAPESNAAIELGFLIRTFLTTHDLGCVFGTDMPVRLAPGVVREPDVSFVAYSRLPGGRVPRDPVAGYIPNLVAEILSPSNTKAEMAQKRAEYFAAGVELAWFLDPATFTAEAYTSPTAKVTLAEADALDGGTVLPGLSVPLAAVFALLGRPAAKPARKPRPRKKP